MKIIHTADLHIGQTTHDNSGDGIIKNFDAIVEYGLKNDVDAMIIAGDVFHARNPSQTMQRDFYTRLSKFSSHAPVVIVAGNHDLPVDPTKASAICMPSIFCVPNVHVIERDAIITLETKNGPLQIACLPYPQKKRLLTHISSGRNAAEIDMIFRQAIIGCVGGMAQEIDTSMPAILVAHLHVAGAQVGNSPPNVLGGDVIIGSFDLSLPAFDYVALGHIHKHQCVSDMYPPVVYSGNIERMDFGDENDTKGFCLVNVEREATTWEFVELDATKFVTVDCDVSHSDNPTSDVHEATKKYDVENAIVRIRVRVSALGCAALFENDVRQQLNLRGAKGVHFLKQRDDAGIRCRVGTKISAMTPEDLLRAFFGHAGKLDAEVDELMTEAKYLMSDDYISEA